MLNLKTWADVFTNINQTEQTTFMNFAVLVFALRFPFLTNFIKVIILAIIHVLSSIRQTVCFKYFYVG
jgi:hypothetical protein